MSQPTIKPRLAPEVSILLVYEAPVTKDWLQHGEIPPPQPGSLLKQMLTGFERFDIHPRSEISIINLADAVKPKAADFKTKADLVQQILDLGFPVVCPVGAKAFEKITGKKGVEKHYGKVLVMEDTGQKVVALPNPAQIRYKPDVAEVLQQAQAVAASERFDTAPCSTNEKLPTVYRAVTDCASWDACKADLAGAELLAFDLETSGFHFKRDFITTWQFSVREGESWVIPTPDCEPPEGESPFWGNTQSLWDEIVSWLQDMFLDEHLHFTGHNLKFDLKFACEYLQVPLPAWERCHDTMTMAFLIDENTPNDLKYLACRHTDMGDYDAELDEWKRAWCKAHKCKLSEFSYASIPFNILFPYAAADTDATLRLFNIFTRYLEAEAQHAPYRMLRRFNYTLAHMEMRGWPVNVENIKAYIADVDARIAATEQEILKHPAVRKASDILAAQQLEKENAKRKNKLSELREPFEFNLASPNQKKVLFFDVMGLEVVKYTTTPDEKGEFTTPSTDKQVMDVWCEKYPQHSDLLGAIQNLGVMKKMRSTYAVNMLEKQVNGFIYPTYNATGARTGRLSSRDPNFQNIPARGTEGKKIKALVDASWLKGWTLLGADLSAAEMRYACWYSNDPKLIDIFCQGLDVHGAIAVEVFNLNCHPNEVKQSYPELRDIAKTIQFLTLYGGGAWNLAQKIRISPERAHKIYEQVNACTEPAEALAQQLSMEVSKAQKALRARDPVQAIRDSFTKTSDEAQEILDNYFARYAGVAMYIERTKAYIRDNGYSQSLFGRKRRVPEVSAEDEKARERAIRQGVNATIQSAASDGLMLSACLLQERIEAENIDWLRPMGPVHDAIYCMVRTDKLLEGRDLLLECMSRFPTSEDLGIDIPSAPIPMVGDAEHGDNWAAFSEEFGTGLTDDEDDNEKEAA